MKLKIFIIFICFGLVNISAQQSSYIAKAEQGDGIFSILRKQGLDPTKYYGQFLELNKEKLKKGSELVLGGEYLIPAAAESFKNMALGIAEDLEGELPIFDSELANISPKSERLKNAVIYLIPGEISIKNYKGLQFVRNQIMRDLAQELMVHGAKVYLIENVKGNSNIALTGNNEPDTTESAIANQQQMHHYIEVINERYLKNMGKYQRVLVINLNETVRDSKYFEVSVFHHGKSLEGERFAKSIQQIFNQNSITKDQKDYTEVFANTNNLYLAKNVVPPVTMIDIGDTKNPSIEERISISSGDEILSNIITSGVLTDYANLSIEK